MHFSKPSDRIKQRNLKLNNSRSINRIAVQFYTEMA